MSTRFVICSLTSLIRFNLSIHRLRLIQLTPVHVATIRESAIKMVVESYNIGQLLNIAVNGLLGYDHQRWLSIFDFCQGAQRLRLRVLLSKEDQSYSFITRQIAVLI